MENRLDRLQRFFLIAGRNHNLLNLPLTDESRLREWNHTDTVSSSMTTIHWQHRSVRCNH